MNGVVWQTAGLLALAVAGCGRRRPGYLHRRQTTSEFGERGAVDSRMVSLGIFFPIEALLSFTAFGRTRAPRDG